MSASTKILVEWTQGRSKGTTSWLKRATVKDGRIAVGEQVKVAWGKSKKLHDAIVKDDGTVPPSVQAPTSVTKRNQAEIELDLGSPASSLPVEDDEFRSPLPLSRCVPDVPSQTPQFPRDDVSELIEKLHDFVSGQNAKIFARLDSLEKDLHARLDYLEKNLSERPEAIHKVCIKNFPLERLETKTMAEKDMRNAIDEACRKTKPITESENCSYV